jgi:diaminohydroxyphosphoribosylaminopyrimidine deaminase/5-amino-6-(5-phosphoribosylamino)uracil reductase
VLDTAARTPVDARLIGAGTPARALIAVGENAAAERVERLAATGATVLRLPTADGRVDPGAVLAALAAREVRAVLLEGGGDVHGSFVDAGLVDRVAIFAAPLLLGGREAAVVVGGRGRRLKEGLRLDDVTVRALGTDVLIEADVRREP